MTARIALWLFWRYLAPAWFPTGELYAVRIVRSYLENPIILISPVVLKEPKI